MGSDPPDDNWLGTNVRLLAFAAALLGAAGTGAHDGNAGWCQIRQRTHRAEAPEPRRREEEAPEADLAAEWARCGTELRHEQPARFAIYKAAARLALRRNRGDLSD